MTWWRWVAAGTIILFLAVTLVVAILSVFPGLLPVLMFTVCWWASPLPSFEDELKTLLKEGVK